MLVFFVSRSFLGIACVQWDGSFDYVGRVSLLSSVLSDIPLGRADEFPVDLLGSWVAAYCMGFIIIILILTKLNVMPVLF